MLSDPERGQFFRVTRALTAHVARAANLELQRKCPLRWVPLVCSVCAAGKNITVEDGLALCSKCVNRK
jgi:hypothetical protein